MATEPDVSSCLPLTEATFFILLSLSPGPKHGYAIMKSVAQMSRGRIEFSTGTLYGALKRLLDQNWIARSGNGEAGEDEGGRARKEYVLTSRGKKVLSSEVARMNELVRLAVAIRPEEF